MKAEWPPASDVTGDREKTPGRWGTRKNKPEDVGEAARENQGREGVRPARGFSTLPRGLFQ